MEKFADWVRSVAMSLGAGGLFIVGFLDSSFLSLPELNDLLLIWMVVEHKERMVLYATASTLGSVAGCLTLYYLGRKGGAALVKRRFGVERTARAAATFERYGVMAVLIPSLLPPPLPFKVFVVLSGVVGISPSRFLVAVCVGRGLRYFGEAFLAVRYGDQALTLLREHGRSATLLLAAVLLTGLAGYVLWRRANRRRTAQDGSENVY
jgi:membrane protein YqaA with SNARE-associated domain